MFKFTVVLFALIACAAAKPGFLATAPLAYTGPLVAAAPAPVVTATSSQVIARNYNGIAHAPIVATAPVAKVVAPVAAPLAVAPAHYSTPVVAKYAAPLAYSTPLGYSAPLSYSAPLAYSAPLSYSAPLNYASHFGYSAPIVV